MANTIGIFISHSWKYGETYDDIIRLLDERGYFNYKDYSVPQDNPIIGARTDAQLREAIKNKMKLAHAFIIPAGMYVSHSKWIKEEIDMAVQMGKPIIGIRPRGQILSSSIALTNCTEIVGWNTESLVSAIRKAYNLY